MSTPSLLLVPARIKAGGTFLGTPGIVYSQIPTNGDGDFRLQRDGLFQTRYNDQGLIERVGTNNNVNVIPRLDYYTSSGTPGCPALLVEPATTNLVLQSEDWNVSPWVATSGGQGSTVSGNVTTSPDGTTNSDKLIEAAVTGTHFCLQSLTLTSGTTYTASFFVKASERTLGRFRMSGATAYWDIDFNLTAGTATGNTNSFIQNYGNGWYRIGGTFTAAQASNNFILSLRDASGNTSYTGNGTNGFFVYGAQVETGSVATSYIPTTTAQRTRNADVISVSGAVSGSIGQTEGVLYVEVDLKNKGVSISRVIYLSDGTSNNEIRISHSVTTAGDLQIAIRLAGSLVVNQTSPTAVYFGINKIAVGYKVGTNEVVMYVNGSQIILSTSSGNMPACNTIHLGSQLGTSNFLNDRIRAAALYTTRLTNADLMLLTMPGNDAYLPQAIWNFYEDSRAGNTEVPTCLYTRHADIIDV